MLIAYSTITRYSYDLLSNTKKSLVRMYRVLGKDREAKANSRKTGTMQNIMQKAILVVIV